ncbi:MAG TPA: cache domain-containing protein, partial [Ideonella sp.]|nr:cache domain-containing protein [Ideonella sp.]
MDLSRPGRHRRLPVLRIRTHLALLVLVTAWPLAALLAYTAQRQAKVEEKQAGAQALRAAQAIAAEAERTLQRAQVLLTQVARRPQVRRLDAADCDPLFGAFGSLFPDYTNLVTVRLDGERVCSALPARPDMPAKVDPRLFLAQTLSSQGFTVGPLTRGIFTGRWILLVAYPLRAEAGELVGAVALSIDLGRLPLAPGLGELPRSARARLYDAAGTVLASNPAAPEAVGQPLGGASGAALSGQAPASPPEGRWRDADGVPCIVGTAPVPGTGWRATVGVPVEAVLGPVRRR